MTEFGITKPVDQAMFIAQVGHESAGFTLLVESFNYSIAALVNFIRAGRLTADQANAFGRRPQERVLPIERQRISLTWYTANAWEQRPVTAGYTVGVDLSRLLASTTTVIAGMG
jgi:predicted chitinase